MTLSPQAQAKMEELALDYMTNHGTLPIEKCDEQERQSFSVGFIAGHAFAREEERFKKECLKEEVLMHAGAYSTDIFPDYSLKENPNPSPNRRGPS